MEAISVSYRLFKKKSISIGLISTGAAVMSALLITACTDQAKADKPKIVYKDTPPKPGIVGKIGDEEITDEALIGDSKLEFLELDKRKWDLKNELFMKLLVDKIIGAKA